MKIAQTLVNPLDDLLSEKFDIVHSNDFKYGAQKDPYPLAVLISVEYFLSSRDIYDNYFNPCLTLSWGTLLVKYGEGPFNIV